MEIRRWERNLMVVALLAGGVPACAPDERPQPPQAQQARNIIADVIVLVTNQTPREKRIYLEAGAIEHPLGVVPAHSSRSFSVPSGTADSASALQLEAREARGASGIRSGGFRLSSGQRVIWTLDDAGRSAVVTR